MMLDSPIVLIALATVAAGLLGIGFLAGAVAARRRSQGDRGTEPQGTKREERARQKSELQQLAYSIDDAADYTQDVADDLQAFNELVADVTRSMQEDSNGAALDAITTSSDLLAKITTLNEVLRHRLERAERRLHEQAQQLKSYMSQARRDALTELPNRRAFNEELNRRIVESSRYEQALAVILFDVDHFKRINDQYGHAAGDAVLRALAEQFQSILRKSDMAARYGGEEFAVILPMSTTDDGIAMGERVRKALQDFTVSWQDHAIPVTISGGVAQWQPDESAGDLLERADEALYAAKAAGRNAIARHDGRRVEVAIASPATDAPPDRRTADPTASPLAPPQPSFREACDQLRQQLEQLASKTKTSSIPPASSSS